MTILENLDVSIFGRALFQRMCDFDRAVMGVRMANESSNEAYEDVGRVIGSDRNCISFRAAQHGSARERSEKREKKNPGSGETRHAELLTHHQMTQPQEEIRRKI